MQNDLIKELEERNVYLSPSMKADIQRAERISNFVVAVMDGVGRVVSSVSSVAKNLSIGNTETSKG